MEDPVLRDNTEIGQAHIMISTAPNWILVNSSKQCFFKVQEQTCNKINISSSEQQLTLITIYFWKFIQKDTFHSDENVKTEVAFEAVKNSSILLM